MPKKQVQDKNEQTTNQSNETQQIFDAITDNDLDALKRLYTWTFSSAKAKDKDSNSQISKLLHAAKRGHAQIVEFLLFHKHDYLDLHHFNTAGENPLLEAIKAGHVDVVRVMARHAFFLRKSFKDNAGNTPFHYVGNIEDDVTRNSMASILIEAGMSFDFVNDKNAKPNHYDDFVKIKQLQQLKYHSSFDEHVYFKPKSDKFTDNLVPFSMICLSSGLLALMHPLVGLSTFLLSSSYFMASLRALNIDNKYKTQLQSTQNESDFIHDVLAGKLTQAMIDKYQQQAGDITFLSTTYKTVLDLAAQSGHLPTVKLIMQNGIRFNPSALNTAIDLGHVEIAAYFLDLDNGDIDLNRKDSKTPLFTALHATKPSKAMVKMLLDRGAYTGISTYASDLKFIIEPPAVIEEAPNRFLGRWFRYAPIVRPEPTTTVLDYVKLLQKHTHEKERQQNFQDFAKLIETANKQRKLKDTASNDVLPAFKNARKAVPTKRPATRPVQQQKETIQRRSTRKKVV